jgi:uncharacterized protein YigA (DUF484 family)
MGRKAKKRHTLVADFGEPVKKPARQARLKGMEDNAIQDLEDAAIEHSDVQAQIRVLRDDLGKIDERLATLMKREGKKTYNHAGIVLRLREGQERVSVKVKRHEVKDTE